MEYNSINIHVEPGHMNPVVTKIFTVHLSSVGLSIIKQESPPA